MIALSDFEYELFSSASFWQGYLTSQYDLLPTPAMTAANCSISLPIHERFLILQFQLPYIETISLSLGQIEDSVPCKLATCDLSHGATDVFRPTEFITVCDCINRHRDDPTAPVDFPFLLLHHFVASPKCESSQLRARMQDVLGSVDYFGKDTLRRYAERWLTRGHDYQWEYSDGHWTHNGWHPLRRRENSAFPFVQFNEMIWAAERCAADGPTPS